MAHTICVVGRHQTVRFAGRELARYLRLATGRAIPVRNVRRPDGRSATFTLGVCDEVGVRRPRHVSGDDDWLRIQPNGRGYVLTGSNPRSVLFAVYRYLQEAGCKWIRPGRRGEIIPKLRSPILRGLDVDERASYRYRTICIEGSCSKQHVTDLIDWMAKHFMNGYFIQFHLGTYFWRRWYSHEGNRYWKRERFDAKAIAQAVTNELTKRDMRFERVGHGWTCAALGLAGEGWDTAKVKVSPQKRKWLAKVNGRRQLWYGVPLNTNLCYSNADVRAAINDAIVRYAADNPQVDAVHFWLADAANNNCECANCCKARPADHYVRMLNELDEQLTQAGLDTKIVFLIYVDLLWPPLRQRIANPDRFILQFAPITRSYLTSLVDSGDERQRMSPFVHNRLQFPRSAAGNLAHLRAWQRQFKGDAFDFDYHLIWACYFDFNQFTLGRTLHRDLRGLKTAGLDGFNSCQVQRQFFPHGLLMNVLARTLWNRRQSFDAIVESSFADAYGPSGGKVAAFFTEMSRLSLPFFEPVFNPSPFFLPSRHTGQADDRRIQQGLRNLAKMQELADDFARLVTRELARNEGAVRTSWRYLSVYLDLLEHLLPAFDAYLNQSPQARQAFEKAIDVLWRHERALHPVLDVNMAASILRKRADEVERFAKGK